MGSAIVVAIALVAVAVLLMESSGVTSGDGTSGATGGVIGMTLPLNSKIQALANAIARAEGFGIAGAVATRAHNPGDLVRGDIGLGVANSAGVTVYASDEAGWAALYHELNLIFTGQSAYIAPTFTFAQFGLVYSGGDPSWSSNVSQILGASPSTVLADWYNA